MDNIHKFDDETKKRKILQIVKNISTRRKLIEPFVNFEYCPGSPANSLVHFHPDFNQICVSPATLRSLSLTDLENQICQIIAKAYSAPGPFGNYSKELELNQLNAWQPPGGVYWSNGKNVSVEPEKKGQRKKIKIVKDVCNFPGCEEKKVKRCIHCRKYFCEQHYKPKEPSTPGFERPDLDKNIGHPDLFYVDKVQNNREIEERLKKEIDAHRKHKKEHPEEETRILPKLIDLDKFWVRKTDAAAEMKTISKQTQEPQSVKKRINLKAILAGILFLVIILILIGSFLFFSKVDQTVYHNVTKSKTILINQSLPSQISFTNYLQNIKQQDGQDVVLKAYLKRYVQGGGTSGAYVYVLTDDQNNNINLVGSYSAFSSLFPKTGRSNDVYEVSGRFKVVQNNLNIQISNIVKSQRDAAKITQIEKIITYEENVSDLKELPEFPEFHQFILKLFNP